ncbi:MAG: hypothetical protein M1820_008445 [Bogoriella megaspora]|nr:MAG: hypothetical protein M1820_008445 [Bogoriella megaspora]
MSSSALEANSVKPRGLSPSPAPRSRSRPKKKPSDPFLELPLTPTHSPSPQLSPEASPEPGASQQTDSIFSHLILSPLLFTSFLLSLFLVDRDNRAYRVSQHSSASSFFHRILPSEWWDPEPYETGNHGSNRGADERKKPWYIKKKHRQVAKLEVTDAFELRTRVLFVMIVGMLTVIITGALGLKKVYQWAWAG